MNPIIAQINALLAAAPSPTPDGGGVLTLPEMNSAIVLIPIAFVIILVSARRLFRPAKNNV